MLKYAEVARSTFYYQLNRMKEPDKYKEIKEEITAIYHENKGRYGYRRITMELHNRGFNINHKTVSKLMKELGLQCFVRAQKYKSYKGDMNGTTKNLLLDKVVDETNHTTKFVQNFSTTSCNQKWTTDVSEFKISSGKLYLSPILDMHNDEIVSYDISITPDFNQIKRMLAGAFDKYDSLNGLIFHSDQGWQYQMRDYKIALQGKGVIQSMSRKGNCCDNGIMEQFFGKIK